MKMFLMIMGAIFCLIFLAAFAFGIVVSIGVYVEERRTDRKNREEGNLKITADKPHRFKKN